MELHSQLQLFMLNKKKEVTIKTSLHNEHLFDVFYDEKKTPFLCFSVRLFLSFVDG